MTFVPTTLRCQRCLATLGVAEDSMRGFECRCGARYTITGGVVTVQPGGAHEPFTVDFDYGAAERRILGTLATSVHHTTSSNSDFSEIMRAITDHVSSPAESPPFIAQNSWPTYNESPTGRRGIQPGELVMLHTGGRAVGRQQQVREFLAAFGVESITHTTLEMPSPKVNPPRTTSWERLLRR